MTDLFGNKVVVKSLVTKVRESFEIRYEEITGNPYYWTAKDAKNCKQPIKKIEYLIQVQNKELSDEIIVSSVVHLMNITTGWTRENLSMPILNSKFNEIINTYKNGKQTIKDNQQRITREILQRNPNL